MAITTLEALRHRAGAFVAVIIGLALLAFVLGDFFNSGRVLFGGDELSVGKVDGVSLEYPDFQRRFEVRMELMRAQDPTGTQSQGMGERARNDVWEEFVQGVVMRNTYEALGLELTDDELLSLVTGPEPSPMIRQLFSDPNTGEFKPEQVVSFLTAFEEGQGLTAEQRAFWLMAERQIADQALQEKLADLVSRGLHVTKAEAEYMAKLEASKVNASYVVVPYGSIPDSAVSVSEAEAKAYYDTHKELYRAPERRNIRYVKFEVTPSDEDVERTQQGIEEMLPAFYQAPDARQFANQNSSTPPATGWLSREQLSPTMAEWAFATTVGDFSPVEKDGQSYRVAKLMGRRIVPDSAHARHILFGLQTYGPERARSMADSVLALLRAGADFAALAAEYSEDPGSKSNGGDLNWFGPGLMVQPFDEACFQGQVGSMTVVETQFGAHIVNVLGHKGGTERVDLAVLVQEVSPGNKTYQKVFNQASAFAVNSNVGGSGTGRVEKVSLLFDSLSRGADASSYMGSGIEASMVSVRGLDDSRELVRWAFGAQLGDVSQVYEMGGGYVVATLQSVEESQGGFADFAVVRSEVEEKVRQQKRGTQLKESLRAAQSANRDLSMIADAVPGAQQGVAEELSFHSYSFGDRGTDLLAVGAALGLKDGEQTSPVVGVQGVYILEAAGVESSGIDAEDVGSALRQSLRNGTAYGLYPALRRMAVVDDNRLKFF